MNLKHLYPTLSPMFLVSALFGMGPIFTTQDNGKHHLKTPKMFKIITVIYIALYTFSLLYGLENMDINIDMFHYGNAMSNIGLILETVGQIILIYAIYISSFITPKHNKNILNKLATIDSVLHDLGYKNTYYQTFWKQVILFLTGICWISITICVQKFIMSKSSTFNLEGALGFVYYFPILVAFIVECQFSIIVFLIYQRFKAINTILRQMSDESDLKILDEYLKDVQAVKPHGAKTTTELRKVETLMEVHDSIIDCADDLNAAYSFQILLCIAILFIKSVFAIFFAYYEEFVLKTPGMAANWAIWSLIDWTEILLLSVTCHKASLQAQQTGVEIHKLLMNSSDNIIRDKLVIFSQQVFHRPVEFSACGLFTIDAPLIFTIIGSTTTYLLIMLQFQEGTETNCIISNGTVI